MGPWLSILALSPTKRGLLEVAFDDDPVAVCGLPDSNGNQFRDLLLTCHRYDDSNSSNIYGLRNRLSGFNLMRLHKVEGDILELSLPGLGSRPGVFKLSDN
jgi:hypothetical protein